MRVASIVVFQVLSWLQLLSLEPCCPKAQVADVLAGAIYSTDFAQLCFSSRQTKDIKIHFSKFLKFLV